MYKIELIAPSSLAKSAAAGNGSRIDFPFEDAEVRILEYPAGSTIPAHLHEANTLHILLEGKATLTQNGETLEFGPSPLICYNCGGFEYGPWKVSANLRMMVITPKQLP